MGFGLGQYNRHGESSASVGKAFRLCQENATAGNSSSPPRDRFSRERSQPGGRSTAQRAVPRPQWAGGGIWIGYIFLDDLGRTKPAFLNSTGVMYPSVE